MTRFRTYGSRAEQLSLAAMAEAPTPGVQGSAEQAAVPSAVSRDAQKLAELRPQDAAAESTMSPLAHLTSQSAAFGLWEVLIFAPEAQEREYMYEGKKRTAYNFRCLLVSTKDSTEYVLGESRGKGMNPAVLKRMSQKFQQRLVFRMTKPSPRSGSVSTEPRTARHGVLPGTGVHASCLPSLSIRTMVMPWSLLAPLPTSGSSRRLWCAHWQAYSGRNPGLPTDAQGRAGRRGRL